MEKIVLRKPWLRLCVEKPPVMQSFICFFVAGLNNLLNSQFADDFRWHDTYVTSL